MQADTLEREFICSLTASLFPVYAHPQGPDSPSHYRPDVDGLRAIAVVSVVIFHAFPSLLPGGFIGVDVFFVISGFLITGLILKDMEAGRFMLAHFYARRTLRIFPALILILLLAWCVGWIALTSTEYRKLGRYVSGGAVFVNNFLFWQDAGYFDSHPDTKPLLHLWSLAVEEQFYLVWPVLLMGLRRMGWIAAGMALLLLLSFAYGVWKVQVDMTGAFYSPLTRLWELLAGAALAYRLHVRGQSGRQTPGTWHAAMEVSALAGVLCLLAGLIWIHPQRAFPGAWALLPVLGAVLLIASGQHSWWGRRLLSQPALVWLGLISYPLYLWHWPLLSFARVLNGETPSPTVRAVLVAFSIGLAYLTYRWWERPIRFGKPSQKKILGLVLAMLVLLLMGQWVNDKRGLSWRHLDKLPARPDTMALGSNRGSLLPHCALLPDEQARSTYCKQQFDDARPRWLVLGDSKAEALYYGLASRSTSDINWVLIGGLSPWRMVDWGTPVMDRLLQDPQLQGVVLVSAMRGLMSVDRDTGRPLVEPDSITQDSWLKDYEAFASRWIARGKQVVVVRDHPTLPDPNDCIEGEMTTLPVLRTLLRRNPNPLCQQTLSDHLTWSQAYDQFLGRLQAHQPALALYSPLHILCDAQENRCPMVRDGAFLYSYGDHLSDVSNSLVANDLLMRLGIATEPPANSSGRSQ